MVENQQSNPILYGVGLIAMVLSISLFFFTIYILPHIAFGAVYDVPEFIVIVTYWYSVIQGLSGISLAATIILPYLLSSAILGLIAKRLTRRVEGKEDINTLSNQSISDLVKPALYEIVLISTVLFSLFFAVYVILLKFE